MSNKILFIIPAYNNPIETNNIISILIKSGHKDLLLIDDGSSIDLLKSIKDEEKIKYIKHDENLGFGAVFMSGIKYAGDFSFDYVIFLDSSYSDINKDITQIMEII